MDPKLAEIIRWLNERKVRATYGAVAAVLGVRPQSMGARLGPHSLEASWIVNASTSLPTGYESSEIHQDVRKSTELIRTGNELRRKMRRNRGR